MTKSSCRCPRALCSSSDRGMGIGELHFQVRYKIPGALFFPRHSPGHFPAVRRLLLPHILPYFQTFSCAGCKDHPCFSKECLQDFSVGNEPRGNGKSSLGPADLPVCISKHQWSGTGIFARVLLEGKFSLAQFTQRRFLFLFPSLLYSDSFLTGSAK